MLAFMLQVLTSHLVPYLTLLSGSLECMTMVYEPTVSLHFGCGSAYTSRVTSCSGPGAGGYSPNLIVLSVVANPQQTTSFNYTARISHS